MTYEMSEDDYSAYSDAYKTAYDHRPRMYPTFASKEAFDRDIAGLYAFANAEYDSAMEREKALYDLWIQGIHKVARETGNKVADVFRWAMEAEGYCANSFHDIETFAWGNGFITQSARLVKIQ